MVAGHLGYFQIRERCACTMIDDDGQTASTSAQTYLMNIQPFYNTQLTASFRRPTLCRYQKYTFWWSRRSAAGGRVRRSRLDGRRNTRPDRATRRGRRDSAVLDRTTLSQEPCVLVRPRHLWQRLTNILYRVQTLAFACTEYRTAASCDSFCRSLSARPDKRCQRVRGPNAGPG